MKHTRKPQANSRDVSKHCAVGCVAGPLVAEAPDGDGRVVSVATHEVGHVVPVPERHNTMLECVTEEQAEQGEGSTCTCT